MKARQMTEVLEKSETKNFQHPDEVREFPRGRVELVKIGGMTVGRATLQPGWRWSESVKPIAKTDSCESSHFIYQLSGTVRIRMDDGTEFDCRAGDVCLIPPGHEGWVVGNEPAIGVDFEGMEKYAESE
jgi:mannose-6-phosphate isomerase-like protein (cupin superfamily)